MACDFEERIERRALGDLPPAELEGLRAHVGGCASCAARFEEASYMETLLMGAFRDAAGAVRSPRAAVLAAIETARPSQRLGRAPAPAVRTLGRRVARLLLLNGIAAALILAASLGYVYRSLVETRREALKLQAKVEVKNLAILLRMRQERRAVRTTAEDLGPALAVLGLERDAFGNSFRLDTAGEAARVYSCGANGRDDRGAGDDIVALVR